MSVFVILILIVLIFPASLASTASHSPHPDAAVVTQSSRPAVEVAWSLPNGTHRCAARNDIFSRQFCVCVTGVPEDTWFYYYECKCHSDTQSLSCQANDSATLNGIMVFNTILIGIVGLALLVPLALLVVLFLASCIRKKVPALPRSANAFQHMNEEEAASDANGPAAL